MKSVKDMRDTLAQYHEESKQDAFIDVIYVVLPSN